MSTLLTLEEACQRVRLSPWAVRRAIQRGELLAYKPRGRLRIPEDALADWLRASAVEPEIVGTDPGDATFNRDPQGACYVSGTSKEGVTR